MSILDADELGIKNGDRVKVRLSGDDEIYVGTVIKARKLWVEFDDDQAIAPFIADETNIVFCELVK